MKIDNILKYYDEGVKIPKTLEGALLKLFNVNSVDNFEKQELAKLKEANKMFYTGYNADYSLLAKEYALYYLPVNMYKIWKPLLDLAIKKQIRNRFDILEFGCGPGSSTFGIIEFFKMLAEENLEEEFTLNFTLLEKEKAFLLVFDTLFNEYKNSLPFNLKITIQKHNKNIFDNLSFLDNESYDLILESNVFNMNEGILDNEIQIMEQLAKKLNKHSSIIMIEPGKLDMLTSLRKIKNYFKGNSLLNIFAPCSCQNSGCEQYATAALRINNILLLQELSKLGIKSKDLNYHYFEYLVLRNDTLTTHTNSCINVIPLSEVKNYEGKRINIEANVLISQITDKSIVLKICDGTLVKKHKIDLYIPLSLINKTNINKSEIDRGSKIRVKKAKVILFNVLECDEACSIEIER